MMRDDNIRLELKGSRFDVSLQVKMETCFCSWSSWSCLCQFVGMLCRKYIFSGERSSLKELTSLVKVNQYLSIWGSWFFCSVTTKINYKVRGSWKEYEFYPFTSRRRTERPYWISEANLLPSHNIYEASLSFPKSSSYDFADVSSYLWGLSKISFLEKVLSTSGMSQSIEERSSVKVITDIFPSQSEILEMRYLCDYRIRIKSDIFTSQLVTSSSSHVNKHVEKSFWIRMIRKSFTKKSLIHRMTCILSLKLFLDREFGQTVRAKILGQKREITL